MNEEYGTLAKYYDVFYKSKDYETETKFLENLIGNRKTILDAGCGTGNHMFILEQKGYNIDGFDLSKDMLTIAKEKVGGNLFLGNILFFNNAKKYDVVISMFAVFNHLSDVYELEKGINNLYNLLDINGLLIIDLHNGRTTSSKTDEVENIKRIMNWEFNSNNMTEHTNIKYIIDDEVYNTYHDFKIFLIDDIKKILNKNHYKYKLYENYSYVEATDKSKNIQIIIEK